MLDNNLPNTENSTKNTQPSAAPHHKTANKAVGSGERRTDKIFKFFSKAGIKKFVLILYCVLPLLIVSIGFAAWIITGNNANGTTGQFTAYGIINSYDYIELNTGNLGGIDFYATGFYKDGTVVKTYAFDITYKLNMTMCANLLKQKSTQDTLTAVFEFCFNSGTEDYSAFFKNLSCQVVVDGDTENPLTVPSQNASTKDIDGVGTITLKYNSESKAENNHQLSLYITPSCDTTEDKNADWSDDTTQKIVTLKLTYTLQPSEDYDYRAIYNLVSSLSAEKPMIDVRITD